MIADSRTFTISKAGLRVPHREHTLATPTSCLRCQKPLAVESVSGLCVTCSQALETEQRTATPHDPASASATAPQHDDHGTATRTGHFDVAADTHLWDGKARHRATPAGYELKSYLGGGGMGDVYLAHEFAADRTVAMKFLRAAADPRSADRFVKEIRALAKVDHPNIIRVITPELDRADPFFTMEFAAGGSLADRVKAQGSMRPDDAARMFVHLARAVQAAHNEAIIHRDIKPGNIVLAEDGTPKLSDFGLAKRMDEEVETKTHASVAVGTPPYMPPEAVSRRHGDFCNESDVYGLGATLYYTLTGRAPYSGEQHEVMRKVETEPPARPRSIRADLPIALEGIVLKCLEKKPADRYASAEALAADLEVYLEGKRLPGAPAMTRRRRVKLWMARNSVWVGIAVAAALGFSVMYVLNQPKDIQAEYRRLLKQGREVTLIPAKGLPAWSEQPIGGIQLSTTIAAEDACTISTVENGTLILMPRVGIDRYRVDAEISEQRLEGAGRQADHHQWCGLLVNYEQHALLDGEKMHSFLGITFRDFPVAAVIGQDHLPEDATFAAGCIIERPGRNPETLRGDSKFRIEFRASPTQPGDWRGIRIVAEPDRAQAFWRQGQEFTRFADLNLQQIRERIALTQRTLRLNMPNLQRPLPDWSPNGGIALWCARGSFAVRNVVVSPVPNP